MATGTYFCTSFILTPETVNPYYTTYVLDYRFPNFKDRVNNSFQYKEWMRDQANSAVNCVWDSAAGLMKGSEAIRDDAEEQVQPQQTS